MKRTVTVRAPGKINLVLDITGKRPDGYHMLNTIMQTVSLYDRITVSLMSGNGIYISCDHPRVPCDENNLVYIAAKSFINRFSCNMSAISIDLQKHIPMQAGLGGGSADAAAVLVGLNSLFDVNADLQTLCEIGAQVGADVPFCILGGTRQAQGIGDEFTLLSPLPKCEIVIAKPSADISTPESFRRYDAQPTARRAKNIDSFLGHINAGELKLLAKEMDNVLEDVSGLTEIADIRGKFMESGALGSMMSGSGSAVFGIFDNRSTAKRCTRRLYGLAQSVFLCRPVSQGAMVVDFN